MKTIISKIKAIHSEKGLNSVYSFLKKNNIVYKIELYDFGLHTSNKTHEAKYNFLNKTSEDSINLHYHSRLVRGRTGYGYNVIRGISIVLC